MEVLRLTVILLVSFVVSCHCYHGRIIIVEDAKVCYRRALAGKRVTRSLVRRAVPCERIEECQEQCAEEKRFVCEGFNYRLDPSGRGNGDCELLDLPMVRLDMVRDIYIDRDYDVYERDRNASPDCKESRPYGFDRYKVRDHRYEIDRRYDDRPPPNYERDRRPYHDDRRFSDRRGDFSEYHHRPPYDRYLPKPAFRPEPYLPERQGYRDRYYFDREKDRDYWGFRNGNDWGSYGGAYGNFGKPASYYGTYLNSHRNFDTNRRYDYLPTKVGGSSDWGTYGGSYGTGGGYKWSPLKPSIASVNVDRNSYGPGTSYLPNFVTPRPPSYLPTYRPFDYTPIGFNPINEITENNFPITNGDVVEHKHFPGRYNFLKDECSLRTATGFRLHKVVVKKFHAVPDIYECEMLCFREKDFECLSYAFRYTTTLNLPTDNCFLSSRSYKDLDFYTDLEPDRDYDIYTINNQNKCQQIIPRSDHYSDCFWHVRSGQRLEHKVVRDSMNVRKIVDCELECLRASKFLCRSFSFRYGPPIIGGSIDNCQLTDWPFLELDPRNQIIPETGFEVYERGSFGYGCEPNHFAIRGKEQPVIGFNTDQLCYVGYGSPARLLPQAIRKSVYVNSELDCRTECSKVRHKSLFYCMSFSFRNKYHRGETNCDLSDILQRDLLVGIDYVPDSTAWLFAWDNYNPQCVPLVEPNLVDPISRVGSTDLGPYLGHNLALDTWRMYSVSGWPCRSGTTCRENRVGGFWFCELEGGDADTWDYCCQPDHQCGYSEGFPYQWCYVGQQRSQWRKCSDRYYPYTTDRHDYIPEFRPKPYLPDYKPPSYGDGPPFIIGKPDPATRPPFRPDRPPSAPLLPPKRPNLNDYEQKFNMQFLDPPKPGGLGAARHWPVSYLHKELPPNEANTTAYRFEKMRMEDTTGKRNIAIQNLIKIIKSNDIANVEYEISNKTKKANDVLLVQIPLPTNFTDKQDKQKRSDHVNLSEPIDLKPETSQQKQQFRARTLDSARSPSFVSSHQVPLYTKSYITRTNVTGHGRFS